MEKKTIIPFGPQHPVLPEPIHLDLVVQDEKVLEALPSIGFIHRGLENLAKKRDYQDYIYVAERVCGICSFMHGMGYAQAIEEIMDVEIPERATYLRTMWAEMSRMHSHLLWLGLVADGFGFESLFMQSWRIREKLLDILDLTTGARVIFSTCKVGGIRRDITPEMVTQILLTMEEIKADFTTLSNTFLNDYTVQKRLVGVGVLTKDEAHSLGAVGPMARASGIDLDIRREGYAAYGQLEFEPVVRNDGDSYGRCAVRIAEIFQSIDLIRQILGKLPGGEIEVKVKGNPNGETFLRLEQPRGEVIYYVKGNGTKFLDRYRVRTPTFANVPAMLKTLQGCDLADVPMLVLTIDPCISCCER